tara:strand:+ start:327 stop:1301 length:975 start_codon:yes stop_codon:yes gene_type:complete
MKAYSIILISALACIWLSCDRTSEFEDIEPEALSDETNYVYCSDQSGSAQIWISRTSGNSQLTKSPHKQSIWPRISPDGASVLFYEVNFDQDVLDPNLASLCLLNISDGKKTNLIGHDKFEWQDHGSANWSNDGNSIVMAVVSGSMTKSQIYICDAAGENPRRITTRNDADYFDPIFSKDDNFIYCSVVPGRPNSSESNTEIFRIDIESGEEKRITYNSTEDYHPCINSEENILVFESLVDPNYLGMGLWQLNKVDLSDSTEIPLLHSKNLSFLPRFKDGSDDIYYVSLDIENLTTSIHITDTEDRASKPLVPDDFNCIGVDPF